MELSLIRWKQIDRQCVVIYFIVVSLDLVIDVPQSHMSFLMGKPNQRFTTNKSFFIFFRARKEAECPVNYVE